MRYVYRAVDRIPANLDPGIVYHSEEFELAAFLCPCDCGHRVMLLVPDSHSVWNQSGFATISPSVGVFDAPCKSHFFIRSGEVDWLNAFSPAQANSIMQRQVQRHVSQDQKLSWLSRLKTTARSIWTKFAALFGR